MKEDHFLLQLKDLIIFLDNMNSDNNQIIGIFVNPMEMKMKNYKISI